MPNQGIMLARKLLRLLCLVGIHDFQTVEVTVGRTSVVTETCRRCGAARTRCCSISPPQGSSPANNGPEEKRQCDAPDTMQTGGAPFPLRQNHQNRPSTGNNTQHCRLAKPNRRAASQNFHKIRQTRYIRIVRDESGLEQHPPVGIAFSDPTGG